jgi:hypothetical protein
MSSASLAIVLDEEMLLARNPRVRIANPHTPVDRLPRKSGARVSRELGGRLLLRYIPRNRAGTFSEGIWLPVWTTPTPLSPDEAISALALPNTSLPRDVVMLLDPVRIRRIRGPRRIRFGQGIEYLLPEGFGPQAIVWEMEVT